jgi:hypothetical protein
MATYDTLQVDIGSAPNDAQGDPLRQAFDKINQRFQELRVFVSNRGDWQPSTAYTANPNRDWVIVNGVGYLATSNHTSGATFAADLAAGKWVDYTQFQDTDLTDYAALRAYTGNKTRVYITGPLGTARPAGIAGTFQWDPSDTTSADNGGTIIVGSDGRRWKRDFSGAVDVKWFEAGSGGSDDAKFEAASQIGREILVTDGVFSVSPAFVNTLSGFVQSAKAVITGGGSLLAQYFHPDKGNAPIKKYWTRMFVGKAANGNGQYNGNASSGAGPGWIERDAQVAVSHQSGLTAIAGASRSSDLPAYHASPATIGVSGAVINDKSGALAWALYGDVERLPDAGASYGLELAVKNKGNNDTRRAYSKVNGALGIWLAGGGDPSYAGAPTAPSNTAIAIGKNGHTWNRGIVFDADGITGTDGVTGSGIAVEMAKGHVVQWSTPTNAAGFTLFGNVADSANSITMRVDDNKIELRGANNKPFFRTSNAANAVNFIECISATSGAAPRALAQGDDVNIDYWIAPKGAGVLRFGTFTTNADAAVNGYIAIKDAGGTLRKLATIA